MRNQSRVDKCVEKLCQKGCSQVWGDIDTLENGGILPETDGMSSGERRRVLSELRSVMSVYAGRCRIPD
jgi:hypothetical protein